jgi:cardiolipin synthase
MIHAQWITACILFVFAGITDALDGYLARLLHQETVLGSYLDPLADKILKIGVFALCMYQGFTTNLLPFWLVWFICIKESIFLLFYTGYIMWTTYKNIPRVSVQPHRWGKMAGFAEVVLISAILFVMSIQSICSSMPCINTLYVEQFILYLAYIVAILNACAIIFYSKRMILKVLQMKNNTIFFGILILITPLFCTYTQEGEISILKKKEVKAKKKSKAAIALEYGENIEQLLGSLRSEMKALLQYEELLFDELSSIVHEHENNTASRLDAKELQECAQIIATQTKESKQRVAQIQKSKNL